MRKLKGILALPLLPLVILADLLLSNMVLGIPTTITDSFADVWQAWKKAYWI